MHWLHNSKIGKWIRGQLFNHNLNIHYFKSFYYKFIYDSIVYYFLLWSVYFYLTISLFLCGVIVTPLCFFIDIMHLFPQSLKIVLRWGHLENVTSLSCARCIRCPDQNFLSLCHRHHVAELCVCCTMLIHSWITVKIVQWASFFFYHSSTVQAEATVHPLEIVVSRSWSPNLRGVSCLPNTVFYAGPLDGFKGARVALSKLFTRKQVPLPFWWCCHMSVIKCLTSF